MHRSSVNLGLPGTLDKAVTFIVLPLLSGSAISDLITQRLFTPISTVIRVAGIIVCITFTR